MEIFIKRHTIEHFIQTSGHSQKITCVASFPFMMFFYLMLTKLPKTHMARLPITLWTSRYKCLNSKAAVTRWSHLHLFSLNYVLHPFILFLILIKFLCTKLTSSCVCGMVLLLFSLYISSPLFTDGVSVTLVFVLNVLLMNKVYLKHIYPNFKRKGKQETEEGRAEGYF